MTDAPQTLSDIPDETIEFLNDLSKEDIHTLKTGLPIIRMIIGFGKVSKWIAITTLGLTVGMVMLWDSTLKILSWFKGQ